MDIYLLALTPDNFLYLDQLFFIVQVDCIIVCEPSFQIVSEWVGHSNSLYQHFLHFSLENLLCVCHVILIKVHLCFIVLHFRYPSTSFH